MITFIKVHDNKQKLAAICNLVFKYFMEGEKISILTASSEAAHYIDELLYNMQQESFLPHSIETNASKERIVITTEPKNFNGASVLINLAPELHPFCKEFAAVFDLYDCTHPTKEELSKKRLAASSQLGLVSHLL
jgi:DNA polymerase-3 subunit chi